VTDVLIATRKTSKTELLLFEGKKNLQKLQCYFNFSVSKLIRVNAILEFGLHNYMWSNSKCKLFNKINKGM